MRSLLRTLGAPARWILIALITGYRRFISPLTPPSCRYHPSCSSYGLLAVQRHGAAKGVLLTGWRVLRCNPFSGGGVDPVPAHGAWRPDVLPNGKPRTPPDAAAPDRSGDHDEAQGDPVTDDPARTAEQGV